MLDTCVVCGKQFYCAEISARLHCSVYCQVYHDPIDDSWSRLHAKGRSRPARTVRSSNMPRKNYTPEERALHLIGALAGKSLEEINAAVAYSDAVKMVPVQRMKELPQSSLDMLKRQYREALTVSPDGPDLAFWGEAWDHCVSPKKVGDL